MTRWYRGARHCHACVTCGADILCDAPQVEDSTACTWMVAQDRREWPLACMDCLPEALILAITQDDEE